MMDTRMTRMIRINSILNYGVIMVCIFILFIRLIFYLLIMQMTEKPMNKSSEKDQY